MALVNSRVGEENLYTILLFISNNLYQIERRIVMREHYQTEL